jgi:Protein of unknown function (DUF1266)
MRPVKTCPLVSVLLLATIATCSCTNVVTTPPATVAGTTPPNHAIARQSGRRIETSDRLQNLRCANSPHAWALATTAIIFEINRQHHDLLAGMEVTPDGVEVGKRVLSQWWDVKGRGNLLRTLKWLQFEDHPTEFEELERRVNALTEREFISIEAAADSNPQVANQLDIVRKHHRALGQKGILAWDLVRYISLCRWGYLAGYFSDTKAWHLIMPAALRLQQTFASWQDLQSDYLTGREFWLVEQSENNGARYRGIYERFVQDSSSPWGLNPWAMDLKVATPLPIQAH